MTEVYDMPKNYYAIIKVEDGFSKELMLVSAPTDEDALMEFREMINDRGL